MKISALQDLYIENLRELYDCEQQIRKALPAAAKAATHQPLKDALEEHIDQGEEHLSRLKEVLEAADADLKPKKCVGISGLISELNELLESDIDPEVLDAGIIAVVQRIEHYEIAAYGCASAFARVMGLEDEADLLCETVNEEKEADEILTDIADTDVNPTAHGEEVENEEEEEEEED